MAAGGRKPNFNDFYGQMEERDNEIDEAQEEVNLKKDRPMRSENSGNDEKGKPAAGFGTRNTCTDLVSDFWSLTWLATKSRWTRHPKTLQPKYLTEVLAGAGPRIYRREKYLPELKTAHYCPDGDKVKRCEEDVMSKPSTVCNWAKCKRTIPSPLKRCCRCYAVSYCDRQCQKKDFKNHKLMCWHIDRYDAAKARVYQAVRFFVDFRHAQDYTVLLSGMPKEKDYITGDFCNVLVQILGRVRNDFRFSFLVMDVEGSVTRVMVHDSRNIYRHPGPDSGRPESSRSLDSWLKPGNFMLLMGAHWRDFCDGIPGIRINDLDAVYFIDMTDKQASPAYKEYMGKFVGFENLRVNLILDKA